MTFLAPLFLAGAAAAIVPLVLHLLKRQPEPRVKFTAVQMLKAAPIEHAERRHLREWLLLALRMAALVLLALAFARPFVPSGAAAAAAPVTVIALDTSFSMGAPGRFERARVLANDALSRVPPTDTVAIVAFSDEATVLMGPGADAGAARAAIARAVPGAGGTRYRSVLAMVSQLVGHRQGSRVVLVTDLQESGWDEGDRASVPAAVDVQVLDVGPAPANLAVTAVRVQGDRIAAVIRGTGPARDVLVRLAVDGRPAGDTRVRVPADGTADVSFLRPSAALEAAVTVDDPTGAVADNTRYAVLDAAERPQALVITANGDLTRDGFYVAQALAAGADVDAYRVTGIGGAALATWTPAQLKPFAGVVMLSTEGLERRGREALTRYVREGGGLLIAASPAVDGEVIADLLGAGSRLRLETSADARPTPRTLAPADVRHPIFEAFGARAGALGLATFMRVARVSGESCQPVARFTTGEAALLDCGAGDGRALVLASDLGQIGNDLPIRSTFVPLLREVMRYLGRHAARDRELVVSRVPAGVPDVPGVALVKDEGEGRNRRVAVNVDPRESDPARLTESAFLASVTRLKDASVAQAVSVAKLQEDRQRLWQYLLAALILMLVAEGALAARTA